MTSVLETTDKIHDKRSAIPQRKLSDPTVEMTATQECLFELVQHRPQSDDSDLMQTSKGLVCPTAAGLSTK